MIDMNKIPTLSREILNNFLIPLNPDIDPACLLNTLNSKLAQVISFKRIKIKETNFSNPFIMNYYAINVMGSGAGKDKTVREIDEYLLYGFKYYFNSANREFIKNREEEIIKDAKDKYNRENSQNKYIEDQKTKIRNMRYELEDATPEGLFSDAVTLNNYGKGSLFIRIPELGLFLEKPTQAQTLFLNTVIKLYDGCASIKSTKGESMSSEVKNTPCNCLLYSDTNKLLNDNAGSYLNKLLDTGLARRSFISYMPNKAVTVQPDHRLELQTRMNAYKAAKELAERINKFLIHIEDSSVYEMVPETFELYFNYQNKNKDLYNKRLKTTDEILQKELQGRHWKTLKLAGLIAAIEHPSEKVIKPKDIEYAIYQSDLFGSNFERFFSTKPQSSTDRLFQFFLKNEGNWVSRMDARKQKFVNENYFRRWFDESIEYVEEMASINNYTLLFENPTKKSGKMKLVANKLGAPLSSDFDFNESIN